MELNLIMNAKGARRIVGDHIDSIDDLELVLVGPNVYHAWFTHQCMSEEIREVTIQWHKDLFEDKLLRKSTELYPQYDGTVAERDLVFP
jgi:hypothetical protein